MNAILDIQTKLQETHGEFASISKIVAKDPSNLALQAIARSLGKRQENLERAFQEAAMQNQWDVCSYRLIKSDDARFPIVAVGNALRNFQGWFSTVVDALKTGPKMKAKVPADIAEQTTLDFGYSFAGSLGMAFTVPNEHQLFGDTKIEEALRWMEHMVQAKEPAQLVEIAKTCGVASIRKMYAWAETHAKYGASVDVNWHHRKEVKSHFFVQSREAQFLCDMIEATSDETSEEVSTIGLLVGADVSHREFHMTFPHADEVRGKFGPEINVETELTLNKTYQVRLRKKSIATYSTDTEKVTWELLSFKALV